MRTIYILSLAFHLGAQPLPPKGERVPLQQMITQPKPSAATGNRDIRRFREAVTNSRPALQQGRGGAPIVWDDAIGYLGRFENSATDPARRLELAAAYQDLGDLLGSPYGWNVGQSGAAVRCYQRAMFLLGGNGRFGGNFRNFPRGYNQSLETLATRLTLLNAPYDLFNGGGFGNQAPVDPPRSALSVQPSPPLANMPVARPDSPAEGVELLEQFATVSGRAQALLGSVDDLRQTLGGRGLSIHEETAGSLGRLRLYLELAATSLEQGSWANARRQLEKADSEATKLARHLGR